MPRSAPRPTVPGPDAFAEALARNAPLFARGIAPNQGELDWFLGPLARWAVRAFGEGAIDEAARGYAAYATDVARAQLAYERTGVFQEATRASIHDRVYDNPAYMRSYMWGALLIWSFWPSMRAHLQMLDRGILDRLCPGDSLLELASGHGLLSLSALERVPGLRARGVDISPHAVALARRLAEASGHADRVEWVVGDALAEASGQGEHAAVIAAMLAEHLPEPQRLFDAIATQLAPEGRAFVSTALESAQPDHVYEFHRESEVVAMAERSGLRVVEMVSESAGAGRRGRWDPRALAMILVLAA